MQRSSDSAFMYGKNICDKINNTHKRHKNHAKGIIYENGGFSAE